jgi:two-component sensor histidine kinase
MLELLNDVFAVGPFIPHGHCYLWLPALVWLHVGTDSLIALAYYVMPIILISFVRKRSDLPFNWMFLMFGAFIIACGTTHVMSVWNLWYPTYWLAGGVKTVTAAVSLATAGLLVPLVPKALALPSPAQLAALNRQLHEQIRERERAEVALRQANDELEKRVQERTTALREANEALQTEVIERRKAEEALRQAHDELEMRIRDRTAELTRANGDLHAEVTQRQHVEAQLTAALEQKDLLLQEVHHRVKNNLQLMTSLLNLQARTLPDPQLGRILDESRQRIQAIAFMHEIFHRTADLGRLEAQPYLRTLLDHLVRVYRLPGQDVRLSLDLAALSWDVNQAMACGLILHELVSNSLTHAFPLGRAGEIAVTLRLEPPGACTFVVHDTGVGLPEAFNIHTTPSLGLRLVTLLARQLEGTFTLTRDGGTRVAVTFPC